MVLQILILPLEDLATLRLSLLLKETMVELVHLIVQVVVVEGERRELLLMAVLVALFMASEHLTEAVLVGVTAFMERQLMVVEAMQTEQQTQAAAVAVGTLR
jgi:hypothetical protein